FGIQLWSSARVTSLGVICLPNDEIFAGLARMGYEKPSTKLTFYKAFFSTQWKFFIHTILHSLSAKRTSWNEFSSAMASALICLTSGQRFNFSKYIFESLVCNVDSSSKFYMYPRFIQLIIQSNIADLSKHTNRYISPVLTQKVFANMRRVGKGFSRIPAQDDDVQEYAAEELANDVVPPTLTSPSPSSHVIPSLPPHQSPSPPQPQATEGSSHLVQQVLDKCSAFVLRVEGLENANAAQQLEIIKLKVRVKKLERLNKVKSSKLRRLKKVGTSQRVESSDDVENVFNQGRMSVDIETDEEVELVVDQEKDAEIEGRHGDKQAKIYNIDLDHSSKVLSMQEDTEVQEAVEVVTTAKLITEVVTAVATQVAAASTPIPAAKPKTLKIAAASAISTRRRKGVVIRDPEEELHTDTPAETPTMKDKGKGILIEDPKPMKKKDLVEMDAEEEMEKEDKEIIKSINETPAQKAAKRRKLSEEAQEADDLKKRLEIVQDEDDNVFVKATPLAQKVPIVDYQVVVIDNKPKEDLETLWRIVKDRFSTKKPTNFLDEYLLLTLKTMFRELDEQDPIWRNQKSVHGLASVKRWKLLTSCGVHVIILSTVQLFLLVERRYLLSRFTLEQLVNVARLQVEEESEMSLELLRFTRQQLLEYQQG
nr:hypothetical protein [Tanacetum cinerariifolium]